jgi:stearoyl-CoA desaturase (Delta-9 desaturase)
MQDSQTQKPRRIDWVNVNFFTIVPIVAIAGLIYYFNRFGFSWGPIILFFVSFVISNMTITTGYHRYFSHRSFDTHPIVEWMFVFFGAGTFQGSVIRWCTDHRRHHREVDSNDDPYSINKGFWFAHLGWILLHEEEHHERRGCPDLQKKKFVMFQDKYYVWLASFVGFILPGIVAAAFGLGFWTGVLFGGALRIVISNHTTFLINSACHFFGRQPYTDKNTARDNFFLSVLTFGEGYHNFHHMFQADYRNGIRWYHWDPTKWAIRVLSYIGLATKLKRVSKEEVMKARLRMDEKTLLSKGACQVSVLALKQKVEETQLKMRLLRDEYLKSRRSIALQESAAKQVADLKAKARVAKIEFKMARAQWGAYVRTYRSVQAAA